MTEPESTNGRPDADAAPRALVVDYGGVLTGPIDGEFRRWTERADVAYEDAATLLAGWAHETGSPIQRLERGEIDTAVFAAEMAAVLRRRDGMSLTADDLVSDMFGRLFAGSDGDGHFGADGTPVLAGMGAVLARAKAAGFRTGLLSNSWGLDYNRAGWDQLFDAVVISGEVGLRKPEPEIYRLTADRLGLTPAECVFVDDIRSNITGAAAVGMIGVHHTDLSTTVEELTALFSIDFRAP